MDGTESAKIDSISVNGVEQTIDENKNVDITVPTKLSDLTNDNNTVQDANYVHTDNNFTNIYKGQIDDNTTNISNINIEQTTQNTNINNLQNNKVDKEAGKGLSTNDFTTAEKTKLANLLIHLVFHLCLDVAL